MFATSVMPENLRANGRLTSRLRFHSAVLDNRNEEDRVQLVTGPYRASSAHWTHLLDTGGRT